MRLSLLLTMSILGILGISCDNDGIDPHDKEPPVIIFLTPQAGQEFSSGQTINIQFTLTENDNLHSFTYHIQNQVTLEIMDAETRHIHGESVELLFPFDPIANEPTAYQVTVSASDHHGNTDSTAVEFTVK